MAEDFTALTNEQLLDNYDVSMAEDLQYPDKPPRELNALRKELLRRLGASGVDVEGLARDLGHMANQVYRANWETRGQWEQYIVEPFAAEIRKHIANHDPRRKCPACLQVEEWMQASAND